MNQPSEPQPLDPAASAEPTVPVEPTAPTDPTDPIEAGWRRLHPLSPLLRGGLVLIVIAGIVIANLRDRIFEIFLPDEFIGETGPSEKDLFDFVIGRGLIIVALLIVLGVILLVVFFSWLSWRFHTFRISAEAVEERSGIVFRQHRRAPLERIQSVNLQRPLLARLLGVTQVDVQTAGQGGKVALRYLGHAQAKEVREQILRASAAAGSEPARRDVAAAADGAAQTDPGGLTEALDRRTRDFVDADVGVEALQTGSLVRVPAGRLVGSILLSWDLLIPVVMFIASIVVAIAARLPFVFGFTVPLALVVAGIGFSHFNRGWGFTLSRSSDGIRVGAGLTATSTETVPLGRIHAIEARQPLAWRPFGWWKMRITTAGHSLAQGGQNRLQNMVLPVGLEADVLRVFETVLPGREGESELAERAAALRDGLVGPAAGYLGAGPRAGWVLWFGRRRAGLRITGVEAEAAELATLRIRRGALTRSLSVMPLVRAQSVQLRRPLVHRMIGLASIQAHTVLGPVRMEMRGIELGEARAVFDRLAEAVVRVQSADAEERAHRSRAGEDGR